MPPAKGYQLDRIRNLGVIAHIDAGKTTTTEHILYYAGATHKLGGVDQGTTVTDYDEEEQERGITIYSACIPFQWRDRTVNLIDTPGHVDFTAEVERSLRVLDGAVVVFDAQKGVEAQSETVWHQANKYGVPRLVFVNKMDVVGADFDNVLAEIRDRLEGVPVPVVVPIGSGSVKDSPAPFAGVIDLLAMEALYFEPPDGKKIRREPIPAELRDKAQAYRDQLFDALTRHDEHDLITSALLEGRPPDPDKVKQLLREQTLKRQIQAVLCGSGREHAGIQSLLDAVCDYLPSPLDRPPVTGTNPKKPGKEEKRKPDTTEPFCGLVFKVVAHPNGERFFVRVYSGVLKPQTRPYNPGKEVKELTGKLYHVHADPLRGLEEVAEAPAGDIVALVGLRQSVTGDTLCETQHPILLEPIQFAEAVVSQSIEPESSADKDKLVTTLDLLQREDPTFRVRVDKDTGQTLMSGMGMLHLEVKRHRMERDFRLKVRVGKPRVSYRETVRAEARAEGEFDRVIGGTAVKAAVTLTLKPDATEKHLPIDYAIDRDTLAPATAAALEQGVRGALESGLLGYPVINVRATVDGVTDSPEVTPTVNEMAVQAAAADAVNKAMRDNMALLEPIMRVEVAVPEEALGPVTADLSARRAEIDDSSPRGKWWVVEARAPLAKLFDYADALRSLSQGRASSTMEPHSYAPAPPDVMRGIIDGDGY
ncbi:MAG TPA: elongation factor G [Gemmataceae bacterium]|jgi:elongation factor G